MLRALRSSSLACLLGAALIVMTGCEQASLLAPSDDAAVSLTTEAPASLNQRAGGTIENQYIVVFTGAVGNVRETARGLVARHGGTLGHTYEHALKGFSATLPDAAVEALRRNPNVDYVEADQVVVAVETQADATWGLDRVDQRTASLDGFYNYNATGAGVTAYILDTGIRYSHNDFGGRAVPGFDAIGDGRNGEDCNGHGTHVAGTVGGTAYGVAKNVSLVAVRVLDCQGSGTTSGVIAGIDWVTANAAKPAVANMSLGGGASTSLDEAVQNSIASGVSYAVAAGNGNRAGREDDACKYSPARVPEAITIGATNSSDTKTSWSNYGDCVDFFAPGASITSAWYTGDDATNTISGTSMATPHVAGAAALYLETNASTSPQQVRDALYNATTKNVVTASSTTNNHLLYSLFDGSTDGGGDLNTAPTASFTFSCTDLACSFDGTGSSDADGDALSYTWDFGDGATATGATASHTYAADGTYTVTLTVSDGAASDSDAQGVTVSSGSDGGGSETFSLSASGYKVKGVQHADLSWSGTAATNIDVYRDGALVATTANDGAYTDTINSRGGGSYTYEVCEAGTSTCSNTATVTY